MNIIFDWSGTLSDDFTVVYEATMKVFDHFKIKKISKEQYRKEFVLPYMRFYRKFTDIPKEALEGVFMEEIYKVGEPKLYPGVKDVLERLKEKGVKMALLTSAPPMKLKLELQNNGFKDFFVAIRAGIHDKEEEIEQMMEELGFRPEETCYVGDMTHDIDAARKAGVRSVGITWGYQTEEQLRTAGADVIIHRIEELAECISKR